MDFVLALDPSQQKIVSYLDKLDHLDFQNMQKSGLELTLDEIKIKKEAAKEMYDKAYGEYISFGTYDSKVKTIRDLMRRLSDYEEKVSKLLK